MNEVRLPPFEYEELKGVRLLEAKSNWAFKHWRIEEIWKHTRGENKRVAVLDTGEPEHKDIDVFRSIDFTGEGPKDKQGHGCLLGNTKVYITGVGPTTLKKFWEKIDSNILEERQGEIKNVPFGFQTLSLNGFTDIKNLYRTKANKKIVIETSIGNFGATSWHKFFVAKFLECKNHQNRFGNPDSHPHRYNGYEIIEKEAIDLEPKDILVGMKFSRNFNPQNSITDIAYLAGEIEGDGTIINIQKKCKYEIRISDKSEKQLKKIAEVIKRLGPSPYIRKVSNTNGYEIGFASKKLVELFSKFSFADTFEDFEQICAWLAGFFDAEGNFDRKKSRIRIANSNYNLLLSIEKILGVFGIKTTIHKVFNKERIIRGRILKASKSFQLYIPNADLFYNLIKPYTLSEKITQGDVKNYIQADVMSINLRALARIRKVEVKNSEDYFYDLSTEAQNYVANGMVVHNTWVSGCVAAKRGFLGLAPGCRLYTAKVLDNQGEGAWLWMKKGLEWAMEEGCDIVNISAGGDYSGNEIQPILKKMADLGIVIVCAAGNENNLLIFPANNENTIAIGSVNEEWQRSIFSNWGPRLISMAPGEDLLGCWLENGYAKASGTSMSSPGVAGILALEAQLRSIDLKGVIAKLAATSEDMKEIGWDAMTGWGIIDPFKFLGLEEPKKKTWSWVWSVLLFLIMYFVFGAPTAVIAKILKKENGRR